MAIDVGYHIPRRYQGLKSCCWLTSIEMLMQHKHGNIYGAGRGQHAPRAQGEYRANKGSHLCLHAEDYNLVCAENLSVNDDVHAWTNALRRGPVLAEGDYGSTTLGMGKHVIIINGVSRSGKLAFVNPNMFGFNWGHVNRLRRGSSAVGQSYMSVKRCIDLSRNDDGVIAYTQSNEGGVERQGPFWQHQDDYQPD